MVHKILTVLLLILLPSFNISSQIWTKLDSSFDNETFKKIQEDFESSWKNKEYERGKGYKPFKRWEYKWAQRRLEDGSFPQAGYDLGQIEKYKKSHPNSDRNVGTWENLGPNSTLGGYAGTGRVNSVAFDPIDNDIIYVGSAGGGMWKSTNGGASWESKTDFIGSIGVSAIVVDPINPDIVYIATGDGDGADNYSIGVLKSSDGGDTWAPTGLNWSTSATDLIRAMVMDPDDNSKLIVASNVGIYRTTNSGATWTQEQSGNFYDVEFKPLTNSNIAYACTSSRIYKSSDDGDTWVSKFSITGSGRMALAVSPNNSNYVYVLSALSSNYGFKAVYRSTDSGESYSSRSTSPNLLGWASNGSDSGGQGWYDLIITADPNNAENVHVGGVNHWKSTNGGSTWSIKSTWNGAGGVPTIHADKHVFAWQGNVLWEGNDGGIYKSANGGTSWTDRTSNLVISQMYRVGISEVDDKVIAGLQDNGTKMRNNASSWSDEIGGDGMDCAINPENAFVLYGSLQKGAIQRSTNGGNGWTNISNNIAGQPEGAWVTPYILDPSTPSTIIAGYNSIYKSTDQGNSWSAIASGWGIGNMTFLAISPTNSNYIYAGNSSNLYRSTNGNTWTKMNTPGSAISMVKVSPSDPNTIYAVLQNYSNGSKVYKSTNGGSTWSNISGTLPNIPANCIAIHNDGNETIYVGMDVGVYYKRDIDSDWTLINAALPNVKIAEIEIKESSNEIYVATFGRGVWKNGTVGESSICLFPSDLVVSEYGSNELTFSWTAPSPAPANGYEWSLQTTIDIPNSGTTTSQTSATVSNLMKDSEYYFFVKSKCSTGSSSWIVLGPVSLRYDCGEILYDSGGTSGDYSNNEDKTYTICPSTPSSKVKVTFNAFSVEANWDALYVHNGSSISAPLFSSENPASDAGFPAGGYWGNTIPGPFTSTDASGCITINFKSDTFVTEAGWQIAATCESDCSSIVTNLNDSGTGSLRSAIDCIDGSSGIVVDQSLLGQVVTLDSPIVIENDVTLMLDGIDYITVHNSGTGPIFNVSSGNTLELDKFHILCSEDNDGAGIINYGTLILHEVSIYKNQNNPNANAVLKNEGQVLIKNELKILPPN